MSNKNKMGLMFKSKLLIQCLFAAVLLLIAGQGLAQNEVLSQMQRIRETYRVKPWMSFDVKYTYAAETAPSVITDSATGAFKMNGNHYWCRIDSMEFMQNDSFTIALYKQESIMSLSLPSPLYPAVSPLANWDSLYKAAGLFTASYTTDGSYKKMTIQFTNPIPYKKTEIWYDSTTLLVHKMQYTIHEESVTGEYAQSSVSGPYIIVSMLFQNYQFNVFSSSVFYTGNYFSMDGPGNYIPAAPYTSYTLYKTAAGL
jgi:hypothetical protein